MNGVDDVRNDYPRVTVVIVTYNGSKYIGNLLASLRTQSYPSEKMNIVVVDNGSVDDTVKIVENNYPETTRIALDENLGFAGGADRGLQAAETDYLAFLNQDVVCTANWLKGLMDRLLDHEGIAACTSAIVPSEPDDELKTGSAGRPERLIYMDLTPLGFTGERSVSGGGRQSVRTVSGCAFAVKKEVLEDKEPLFCEGFRMYGEDLDLSLRLIGRGYDIEAVTDSVVYHFHDNAFRRKNVRMVMTAVRNRNLAYFMNMDLFEFLVFFPFLWIGGTGKLFYTPLSPAKKVLLLLPFFILCTAGTAQALWKFPNFIQRRRNILNKRRIQRWGLLKMLWRGRRAFEKTPRQTDKTAVNGCMKV